MKNLLWRLPELPPNSQSGISGTYILPKNHAPAELERMVGSRIWTVVRSGQQDIVSGFLHVERVEVFVDGLHKGDYCLTVDLGRSLKTTNSRNPAFRVELPASQTAISEIEEKHTKELAETILRTIPAKLLPPTEKLLAKLPRAAVLPAGRWITAATSAYALDEIWAGRAPLQGLPFANFVRHRITQIATHRPNDTEIQALLEADPIRMLSVVESSAEPNIRTTLTHSVDTRLVPIDPGSIYARTFVASLEPLTMEKTAAAEKRHQDMLRDIVDHLLSAGHTPMQSGSIDLCVESESDMIIFELKTTTADNLTEQAAKGIFQLGHYRRALEIAGSPHVRMVLVLEKSEHENVNDTIADIFSGFGGETFFYNPNSPWPQRTQFGDATLVSALLKKRK